MLHSTGTWGYYLRNDDLLLHLSDLNNDLLFHSTEHLYALLKIITCSMKRCINRWKTQQATKPKKKSRLRITATRTHQNRLVNCTDRPCNVKKHPKQREVKLDWWELFCSWCATAYFLTEHGEFCAIWLTRRKLTYMTEQDTRASS